MHNHSSLAGIRLILTCVIASGISASLRADGLIYQLPPDGSWVRYDVKMDGMTEAGGKQPAKMTLDGSLRLSSVGQRDVDGKPCRWIEIAFEAAPAGMENKASRVLKILIPEANLKRGDDPFAHVLEMYYSQRGGGLPAIKMEKIEASDKIDGSDYPRRQYEIDRLRSIFPRPLTETRSEPAKTVDTKLGKLECENVIGKSVLPESPLRGGGKWAWSGEFECLLTKRIPFGVAVLCSQTKGQETTRVKALFDTTITLTVVEIGADATSALPDAR